MNETSSEATGIRHPLIDSVHVGWVHTESRAPVIHLSEGRADLFNQAAANGLRVILVTDELSALTEPYYQAMTGNRGSWVVRAQDGSLRNGVSGARLEHVAEALDSHLIANTDDVAVAFLRPQPIDQLELIITASVRHKALSTTVLGGALESLSTVLRGTPPSGWDVHEPISGAWDRQALTEYARGRMPAETLLLANDPDGPPLIATILAQRSTHGVEETTKAFIGMGIPGSEGVRTAAERTLEAFAQLAAPTTSGMPLIAFALARPGSVRQLHSPVLPIPPVPLALLIGPPGVKALGLDAARCRRDFDAIVVGRPRIPGLLFPLGDLDGRGWETLDALLASFDQTKMNALLGENESLLAGLDTRKSDRAPQP